MNILKKTMFATLAVATMSMGTVPFTATSANAWHYGSAHGGSTYQKPAPYCHWGWVKWKDSYGWHRKWKHHCNHSRKRH